MKSVENTIYAFIKKLYISKKKSPRKDKNLKGTSSIGDRASATNKTQSVNKPTKKTKIGGRSKP